MPEFYEEALDRFERIYSNIKKLNLIEPTAVTLATADKHGRPSGRVVLLKGHDERGFVIYTNFHSQKGKELLENPWASLCFFWDPSKYQIRVEGKVEPVSAEEADAYWVTRPRNSQVGAWASLQSEEMENRRTFFKRIAAFSLKFAGRPVPRPAHWSGFRIIPNRIEFWKRKAFRLHERILYEKKGSSWGRKILYP